MLRRSLLVLLLGLSLTGCLRGPAATVTGTTPATEPAPVVTSPSALPPRTPAPSTTAVTVPDASGTLEVSRYEVVDFASPSGRIWCGMRDNITLCHFPFGFRGTVPKSADVCPGEELDVTGVTLTTAGPDYFCSGDPQAMPDRGTPQVDWHRVTGFPFVAFDGHTLATLPYGEGLHRGDQVCRSDTDGITCGDTVTRHGFRVARAAVVLF